MPTRVYQLAKELKVEINELLGICARAGIEGKGSALANLSDEEVAKVKAFLGCLAGSERPAYPAGMQGMHYNDWRKQRRGDNGAGT